MDDKVKAAITDDITKTIKSVIAPAAGAMKKELDKQVESMKRQSDVMDKERQRFTQEIREHRKLFWVGVICSVGTPVLLAAMIILYFV